jgi:large subunit ribosomal protein L19
MSLFAKHKETKFGVGDRVKVVQEIVESGKKRTQAYEGMVIAIRGREENKSFIARRVGVGQIGIERIFQLSSPLIKKIEIVRAGTKGVRKAKLFYTREKPRKEIDKIYSRAARRESAKQVKIKKEKAKTKATRKPSKKK